MIKKADFAVSFNGKKILDQEANIRFKNTNLRGLLYAQGYSDKEIIQLKIILIPMPQIWYHFQSLQVKELLFFFV